MLFGLVFCLLDGPLALGFLLNGGFFEFYASELRIYNNATAIFADDDFFVHLDIKLTLRRNLVKASAAGITLNIDDTQSVASVFANTFKAAQ